MQPHSPRPPVWDFFLAHAHRDAERARELHRLLGQEYSVFLDRACIEPAEDWSSILPRAQQESKVTVALISGRLDSAHYAREEIQRGIALNRAYPSHHRIVPVYLDGKPPIGEEIPYGLWLLEDLDVVRDGGLEGVAARLREMLNGRSSEWAMKVEPAHVLHAYPRGPLVAAHWIRSSLIEAFADLIRPRQAGQMIAEANAFRAEANPGDAAVTHIRVIDLPDPLAVPPRDFWTAVFTEARLHGPRMLAALILSVPPDRMHRTAAEEREALLRRLRGMTDSGGRTERSTTRTERGGAS